MRRTGYNIDEPLHQHPDEIGSERIELVDELPEVSSTPPDLELMLGNRVSLSEARRRASFDLLELEEEPDAV